MTDRELLEILARHVMGWQCEELRWPPDSPLGANRRYGIVYHGVESRAKQTDPQGRSRLYLYDDDSPYIEKNEGWNPLVDIADAWMLVEKLGLTITPAATRGRWICARCQPGRSTIHIGATGSAADTAPRAICLAAYELRKPS